MKTKLYILLLCAIVPMMALAQHSGKMSSYVRRVAAEQRTAMKAKSAGTAKEACLTALVRCADPKAFVGNGCRVLATFDNDIYIASIPLSRLDALASERTVSRIEANQSCSVCNDTTRMIIKTGDVLQSIRGICTPAVSGEGSVVVGVMDIGFDLTHPTFGNFNGDGCRIKRFWDMIDPDSIGSGMYVGREYTTQEEILQKGCATDGRKLIHGTHTAGTAAGSGSEGAGRLSPYSLWQNTDGTTDGINLPDIVLVANSTSEDKEFVPKEMAAKYTTSTDLLGFKYIFDYAAAVGKPCVISFSEGSHPDFYDTILYDEVLRQLSGPGRIIVTSAGNEGQKLSYLTPGQEKKSVRSLYYSNDPSVMLLFRASQSADFDVTLDCLGDNPYVYHVSTAEILEDEFRMDTIQVNGAEYILSTVWYANRYNESQIAGEFVMYDLSHKVFGSQQQRVCLSIDEGSDTELFYYSGQFWDDPALPSDAKRTHNILFPGSSPYVICVGNNGFRPGFQNISNEWKTSAYILQDGALNPYSSIGPSITGLPKPDVVAPGTLTLSGFSSFFLEANPTTGELTWVKRLFKHNDRTYGWISNSGTSMSTPVVAATVAMWLQACPTLTTDQVKQTFQAVCPTMAVGGADVPYFGPENGGAAYAGMKYILENFVTGIRDIPASDNMNGNIYDLSGRRVTTPTHGIYIIGGKKVVR